jgi:hypothetical protein
MIKSIKFYVVLTAISFIFVINTGSVLSQPPTGSSQAQMGQQGQTSQQMGSNQGQQGGPGSQQGQGFGQRQMQTQDQMQAQITQNLKQMLGSTDEEWAIIGPKVLKVYTLASSQSTGFNMRNLMRRNNAQGDTQGNAQSSNTQGQGNQQGSMQQGRGMDNRSTGMSNDTTLTELQTLLESQDATTSQIKNKVAEVRSAREKAKQDLAKAQKELRELLTVKQEAILISVGLLE